MCVCMCVCVCESSFSEICVSEACEDTCGWVYSHPCMCARRLVSVINTSGVCLHAQYQFGKLSFTKLYTQIFNTVCTVRSVSGHVCVDVCGCVCVIVIL